MLVPSPGVPLSNQIIRSFRKLVGDISQHLPVVHEMRPKKLYPSVAVPPLLSRFLAEGHLPRISRQSANNSDNEVIPGTVHRPPGIPQLGDRR